MEAAAQRVPPAPTQLLLHLGTYVCLSAICQIMAYLQQQGSTVRNVTDRINKQMWPNGRMVGWAQVELAVQPPTRGEFWVGSLKFGKTSFVLHLKCGNT